AGSSFNTVLYVREQCQQEAMGTDLACNDDGHDAPPASTLFLADLMPGRDLFIVVDGARDAAMPDAPSSGAFLLTITPVTRGTMGNRGRAMEDGNAAPRCDGALVCSDSALGPLCVSAVTVGAMCDPTGFANACPGEARCVSDPSPPDGTAPPTLCEMPGT